MRKDFNYTIPNASTCNRSILAGAVTIKVRHRYITVTAFFFHRPSYFRVDYSQNAAFPAKHYNNLPTISHMQPPPPPHPPRDPAVVLYSEVMYGSCSGAESLAGCTAPSVRHRRAAPLAIQFLIARLSDLHAIYLTIIP